MNIKSCIGWVKGGKDRSSPGVQKSAMDSIYPAYVETDIIVLASPLSYWSVSGLLKITFDRFYATAEANAHVTHVKDCILLMAAGNPSLKVYEPYLRFHESLMHHLGWSDVGRVLTTGVMMPGDIKVKPELENAKQMGKLLS